MSEIGKRVVGRPDHLPTMKGYFGCRRGVVVGKGTVGWIVDFDPIGRERTVKRKEIPGNCLCHEDAWDEFLEKTGQKDPLAEDAHA